MFRRGSFDVKTAGKRHYEDKSHLLVFLRAVGQQDAFLHVAVENPLDRRHVAFYDVFHLTSKTGGIVSTIETFWLNGTERKQ